MINLISQKIIFLNMVSKSVEKISSMFWKDLVHFSLEKRSFYLYELISIALLTMEVIFIIFSQAWNAKSRI